MNIDKDTFVAIDHKNIYHRVQNGQVVRTIKNVSRASRLRLNRLLFNQGKTAHITFFGEGENNENLQKHPSRVSPFWPW